MKKNNHQSNGTYPPVQTAAVCSCLASRLLVAIARELQRELQTRCSAATNLDRDLPALASPHRGSAGAGLDSLNSGSSSAASPRRLRHGSVRECVYEVLRQTGPLRRIEIVRAVAASLGLPADEQMEKRVEVILLHRHDTHLRRISRGVYEFIPAAAREHAKQSRRT